MIVPKQRAVIVRVSSHKAIKVIEALTTGPVLKWTALRDLRQWRVIPFAQRKSFKTRMLKVLRNGLRALGRRAVVTWEAHCGERVRAQADAMWIPSRHHRRA